MAKLIYSSAEWASASNATDGALRNYADSGDIFYKTLIFTKDGFLVTHGKVFRMVDTESLTSSVTINISSTTGKVTLTDGFNGKQSVASLPVWKLTQGDYLTINNSGGNWTISHNEPDSSNNENITTLSTVFTDYVLTKHIDNMQNLLFLELHNLNEGFSILVYSFVYDPICQIQCYLYVLLIHNL